MQERESRQQLLEYHLKELNEFLPVQGEFEEIDQEYKQLANHGQFYLLVKQPRTCYLKMMMRTSLVY